MNQTTQEAKDNLLKASKCLYLELPASIADDVKNKVHAYINAVEQSPDPGVAVLMEALKKIEIWTQFQIDEKTRTTINLLCKHVIASVQ